MKTALLFFLLIALVLYGCTSTSAGIPALNAGEVPSWDVHIGPLMKRYCVSCHRAGKKVNNNYLLTTYDGMLHSGDNAPVIVTNDPNSLLIQLISGHASTDPQTGKKIRQMPPNKLIAPQYIDMLTLWVKTGMPQTAADAALFFQLGQRDGMASQP